jgi:hypothetical protein
MLLKVTAAAVEKALFGGLQVPEPIFGAAEGPTSPKRMGRSPAAR